MPTGVNYSEDLVPRIRNLIDQYTVDTILKEYLQNADDSGATELIVTFDKSMHPYLIDTKFEVAKESSLLLYNNASFKEEDFKAIIKLSAQGKTQDANATGRFGLGFTTSFSVSDHPSFVSSGKAYWFDVLQNAVSKDEKESIQIWNLKEDKEEMSQWLRTFKIDSDKPGTTFRLPLRNKKTANQTTANKNKISNEVFKYEDFLKWCVEWKENTSWLLFLRHIQKLILQEINEDGDTIVHLEISTENSEEILKYNNEMREEFSPSLLNTCKKWKSNDKALPLFIYKHYFSIRHFDRANETHLVFKENWAIVNGLFRGENNNLIDQAIKVLNISPNHRKVLPWAGVAISLNEKGKVKKHNKSNYHTFLPLEINLTHPVHIHGWFDLNSTRTEITKGSSSSDDKKILIEWNRLLFAEGVGIAWACLINFIKDNCSSKTYYSLWPRDQGDEFDEYIVEGFYKKITEFECFKTKYKEEICWNTPIDDIYSFQNNSDIKLSEAFKEHFSIILPEPSLHIINSLSDTGTDLKEITPEFIRDHLTKESKILEFPFALEDMPIAMLSKKDWLLSILIFCAEADEDKDYYHLEDLPLELTLDNNVNCPNSYKLLDSNPNLYIFNDDSSLFLHSEIIEIVKDGSNLPSSWLTSSLKSYLVVLHDHIENYDLKDKSWLKSLVSMISKADKREISEAINELSKLKFVYQHDGTFVQLRSDTDSPVLIPEVAVPNIDYLVKTGMKLVHPDYINIYQPLLKCNELELITELNSHSLIKHLINRPNDEYEFFKDKDTREYLIDLFAQDINWMDELNDLETEFLDDMPFIATESGNTYAKSEDKQLYLPAGFIPPKHIQKLKGEYEIIIDVDKKQHAMYEKMGFTEQNSINYLKQIIIPFIENEPSVDDVRQILEWLANNWEHLTKDIDEEKKEELIDKLSAATIVLDADYHLKTAKDYYHPDFFSCLPDVLQDKRYSPLKFEDPATQENWSYLLSQLGASRKIISGNIVATIESIIEEDSDKRAIELLNYISNHFELFEKMEYEEENIFQYLSTHEWLPAEKPENSFLVPKVGYKKLQKPSDLILKNDYKLLGGAHYRLSIKVKLGKKDEHGEFKDKYIAEKLGLLVKLPNISIFDSFRRLVSIKIEKSLENKILNFAKEFYQYLDRSGISTEDIPEDIKNKSVFINGHWLPSSKVFQHVIKITGIYSWDDLLLKSGKESPLAKGLIKLGVLEEPDNEYLVNYLFIKLPQSQKLDKRQLTEAKTILHILQGNLKELSVNDIPLLSRSDQLVPSNTIYINDLPAYDKSDQKNDQLDFCQAQFNQIAEHFDVVSLAENITDVLDKEKSSFSDEYNNNDWDDFIRSDPFKSAVLRLIYHEGKLIAEEIEQESLDKILPSKILLTDSLVVRFFIDETWIYDAESPAYEDTESSTLYLRHQEDEEDMCESIAKFISESSKLGRDSFSLIGRILRHRDDDFEEIHNLLDRKNIKSLPERIKIDESLSLYGKNSGIEQTEDDRESLFFNNIEDEQVSLHENYPPMQGDTQSSPIGSKGKQREVQLGSEIAPPINPKKSNSTNFEGDSFGQENGNEQNVKLGSQKGGKTASDVGANPYGSNRNKLGSSSNNNIVSPNDRKPVYVGKEREIKSDKQLEQKSRAIEIGNKGETYVLERSTNYLLSKSNNFEKAPINNKGFDILEIDSNGDIVRYIEVKTLTGVWGEGGVAVTESQLEFAQVYDNWWLFVVENINTQNTHVHLFENPVQQANRYIFDHSWKQLAQLPKKTPKKGYKYLLPDGDIYEVMSLETKGKFYKVKLKEIKIGKEVIKKFDSSWEQR